MGLFLGMMFARRVGIYFEVKRRTVGFMGWSLLVQGIVFAVVGVMPTLWLACVVLMISRVILSAEFAVQEAYNRPPTAKEAEIAKQSIAAETDPKEGLRLFIQAIFGANDFLYSH